MSITLLLQPFLEVFLLLLDVLPEFIVFFSQTTQFNSQLVQFLRFLLHLMAHFSVFVIKRMVAAVLCN